MRATRPLVIDAAVVTDLELRFDGGRVTHVGAGSGGEVVSTRSGCGAAGSGPAPHSARAWLTVIPVRSPARSAGS